jgi:RNA polymerase sigma-70 factor (sigma-E family)
MRKTPERAAISELFNKHYRSLVGLAFLVTTDEAVAEDLAQEAFLRLWRMWDRLDDSEAAIGYLRSTVTNLGRSWLRRRLVSRRKLRLIGSHVQVEPDVSQRTEVIDALRRLPSRQRACIALRYFEGLTEKDTADVLDISVGTVKSQTHKALQRLKGFLKEDSDDY